MPSVVPSGSSTLRRLATAMLPISVALLAGCAGPMHNSPRTAHSLRPDTTRQTPFVRRAFDPTLQGKWVGLGVAYGPHRDGQAPWGPGPTRAQIREDLRIIARHWSLIRMYGSVGAADTVLSVIREERLPIRVMVGFWLAREERRDTSGAVVESFPENVNANEAETEAAVRLANAYPDLCVAISAGNETQVTWSDHVIPAERLIRAIRSVRARTRVPVTTADDFNFWNKPESRAVAGEVDFILLHLHPLWNGKQLGEALEWTTGVIASIQALHAGHAVIVGETGWATARSNEGEQASLIKGATGEAEQKVFVDAYVAWARQQRMATFLFEAFDENWKGGSHPEEVEKQ